MPSWGDNEARAGLLGRLLPALAGLATELLYVLALLASGLVITAVARLLP